MSGLVIEGGKPLCGVVRIQGAKNSVLPIAAACLLTDGVCTIENCPQIRDVQTSVEILEDLGCRCSFEENVLTVSAKKADGYEIPDRLMRRMRSSIIFLGALLTRNGRARISKPGGCDIGSRPVDMHFAALARMGVTFREIHGYIECEAEKLKGAEILLPYPSVGATENVILAAVRAHGNTVIHNAAKEPEIEDLQNFLNEMGARISGAGTSVIRIAGVSALSGVRHRIIPDRIVAATYLCAVAATHGNALLKDVYPAHLTAFLSLLRDAGCEIEEFDDAVSVSCDGLHRIASADVIRSMPYPGFPTDCGSPFVAMMSLAAGTTVFAETVFENRFKYIGELLRMGAKIRTEGRVAVIDGVRKLYGADVEATDLRGGAALVVAGLAAQGRTEIGKAEYILRGYEKMDENMRVLGAEISSV